MNSPTETLKCYACHKTPSLTAGEKILRNEECPYCYASLHCCKMCSFYDSQAYNECREPNAERVVEKEKANYCDYFVLKGSSSDQGPNKDSLFSAAESLFKD